MRVINLFSTNASLSQRAGPSTKAQYLPTAVGDL